MPEDTEVIESETNRVSGSPDQICFKLPVEEKTAFMSRLAKDGEKATPLLRAFVRDYMARGEAEASLGVADRKRAERYAYIISALREFAATHRGNMAFLEGMDRVLGFRPGTLSAMDVTKL